MVCHDQLFTYDCLIFPYSDLHTTVYQKPKKLYGLKTKKEKEMEEILRNFDPAKGRDKEDSGDELDDSTVY